MHWYLRVLLKYAVFEGRARRKEFWYFKLFHNLIIFSLILRGIYQALTKTYDEENLFELVFTLLPPFFWFYLLVTFLPNLAVSVRRLHDINKGGENLLMWLVAPVGTLILFVFHAMPGTKGPNAYGPDPITHPNYVPPRKKRHQRTTKNRPRRRPTSEQQEEEQRVE